MLYTFFMEQVWAKFGRNAFSFQNRTICDLHVFTTSGNNLSLIRQALHHCSSIYFTSSLWNRAQFVALKESVKYIGILWNTYEILWNTMKYFLKFAFILRMELLDGATYKVASAARERLWELALSLQCLGQWDFRPAAFSICFCKISHDYMIQMIRFHKSDSSFFEPYRFPRGRRCSSATWGHASALSSGM